MLGVGADADGVDFHAFLGRQARGGQRVDLPGVVGAVGDQDQHTALRRALAQAFYGQADGVADGGVLASNTDARFIQPGAHGAAVKGQGRLQVGLAAEQDQAHAVTFTLLQKVSQQVLDQGQAADVLVLPMHVGKIHGAGDIHRHQQIPAAGSNRQGFAQPLRAGGGGQQQQPQHHECGLLAPAGQVDAGTAAGQAFEVAEVADFQRRFAAVGHGQHQAHDPGQWQQGEDPRPGELKHVCESRCRRLG
ncbi:hypothetical protein PFLL34_00047 [Pseudomonas fluorescens]|nr:hypothetical protein PFLL34_00047 [Pseudomonas fluorescens]